MKRRIRVLVFIRKIYGLSYLISQISNIYACLNTMYSWCVQVSKLMVPKYKTPFNGNI